jgi:hypothetical protein
MCQLKRSPGLLWQPRFGSRSERAVQGSGPSLLSASVQRGFARWLGSLESSVALLASSFQFGPSAIPARPEIPSPKNRTAACLSAVCLSIFALAKEPNRAPGDRVLVVRVCGPPRVGSSRRTAQRCFARPGQSRPVSPSLARLLGMGWASCRPACESIDSSGGG